jgi:hypothetical protein
MHMRIQACTDNPSKANNKLCYVCLYQAEAALHTVQFTKRSMVNVRTHWPLGSKWKGMGLPHSSEDRK